MATATLVFLIIGGVGVVVLTLALLGAELLHLANPNVDGPVPLEVAAGFTGALGFGAAIANELLGGDSPAEIAGAVGLGLLAAVPTAWLAAKLSRAARDMRTDATPTRNDLVGALGVVVTPIPANGYGEVRVRVAGQPVKLNARADRPVPTGAQVFVVESLSETSVHVETY
ncbi:hypothetical protein [Micromonospora echinofusca]|uniref:NfeD-like C-terminal domain-containing protein n=1 Tax=Micromonospora echinofusca TaxID=47858 RepID=A0ABS3VIZ2_MICEH|nr:hypothetical protein [Micromonospora echinofusca]MBO4204497.1 hypothetical protein [Micromonospora echinofusca]